MKHDDTRAAEAPWLGLDLLARHIDAIAAEDEFRHPFGPNAHRDHFYYEVRGRMLQSAAVSRAASQAARALWRPVGAVFDALRRWRAERITCAALRDLDDHLLRDIGLERHEIGLASRLTARGEPWSVPKTPVPTKPAPPAEDTPTMRRAA